MSEELQPWIKAFLEMIEKRLKHRLGKTESFFDSAYFAYYYLVEQAKKFDAGELVDEDLTAALDLFMAELYNKLTIENSEWLKAKIGEILLRHSGDVRQPLLDASELVTEVQEVRHTKGWVVKAEKVLETLQQIEMAEALSVALEPFVAQEFEAGSPVPMARALLDTPITKSWEDKVRATIKLLKDLRPRDFANEANLLKESLEAELALKVIASDNRVVFFEARNLLKDFELTETWVKKAEVTLIAVRIERTLIGGKKVVNFWNQNLPKDFEDEKVKVLQDLLNVSEVERSLFWSIQVDEAQKALKGHDPLCPGCNKNKLKRKDSNPGAKDGKGPYYDRCYTCKNPPVTAAALLKKEPQSETVAVVPEDVGAGILALKKLWENGERVEVDPDTAAAAVGPAGKGSKYSNKQKKPADAKS
jgi:hypothetical protein